MLNILLTRRYPQRFYGDSPADRHKRRSTGGHPATRGEAGHVPLDFQQEKMMISPLLEGAFEVFKKKLLGMDHITLHVIES